MAFYGCHICKTYGKNWTGGMYFPGVASKFKIREKEDFHEIDMTKNGTTISPISVFPTFNGPSFVGLDAMHLLGLCLSKLLKNIFAEKQNHFMVSKNLPGGRDRKYPFLLDDLKLAQVGKAMSSSKKNIPAQFSGDFNDIITKGGRAVDWMDFMLYVSPPHCAKNQRIQGYDRRHIRNLVMACHICLQRKIRRSDLKFVKRYSTVYMHDFFI
ncbi:unnamed protein product [Absidia cylindrospora]